MHTQYETGTTMLETELQEVVDSAARLYLMRIHAKVPMHYAICLQLTQLLSPTGDSLTRPMFAYVQFEEEIDADIFAHDVLKACEKHHVNSHRVWLTKSQILSTFNQDTGEMKLTALYPEDVSVERVIQ